MLYMGCYSYRVGGHIRLWRRVGASEGLCDVTQAGFPLQICTKIKPYFVNVG